MTAYTFETITAAEAANYSAASDTLQFATPGENAWQASLVFTDPQTATDYVTVTLGGRSVDFGFGIHGSQAQFTDGSILFIGCPMRDDWWAGGAGADAMYGVAGDDSLTGLGGADLLMGGPGRDTLLGGLGDDLLDGGDDNDSLDGGAGANVLFGRGGDDHIVGGADFNRVNGNTGNDTLVGRSAVGDWLLGGQGQDFIDASASSGRNFINGNIGNDTLVGGSAGDILRGGQGDDVIHAGAGDQWISGDLGANTLYGGQGMDTFHAGAGRDVVTGWHAGDHVQVDSGVTWTAAQADTDVHISFSNGGAMDLLNTQLSSLQSGWIGA